MQRRRARPVPRAARDRDRQLRDEAQRLALIGYARGMRPLLAIAICCAVAAAKPPALEPYNAGAFSVSLPKGWAVTADMAKGTVLAQQDPRRKDGAEVLVVVAASAATEDQALDQTVQTLKVVKRGAAPGGGKLVVAEGVSEGIKVRLGAVAVAANGTLVMAVLISKVEDFDGLGGTEPVAKTVASYVAAAAPAPASGAQTITLADLAGEWKRGGGELASYSG